MSSGSVLTKANARSSKSFMVKASSSSCWERNSSAWTRSHYPYKYTYLDTTPGQVRQRYKTGNRQVTDRVSTRDDHCDVLVVFTCRQDGSTCQKRVFRLFETVPRKFNITHISLPCGSSPKLEYFWRKQWETDWERKWKMPKTMK